MKKTHFFLVVGLAVLWGCAPLAVEQRAPNPYDVAERFLQFLLEKDYKHAYDLFAHDFQKEVSYPQLTGLLAIVRDELGDMRGFESRPIPLLALSPMEHAMVKKHPEGVSNRLIYQLDFEKGPLIAKIMIVNEKENLKVGVFEFVDVPFADDPDVRRRVQALGF